MNGWITLNINHSGLLFSGTVPEEARHQFLGNLLSLLAANSLNLRGCEGNALSQSYSINSKPITEQKGVK